MADVYDSVAIINRIIENLKKDTDIYEKDGKDGKIPKIFFGNPNNNNWLSHPRPYIAVAPGEPYELSDTEEYVSSISNDASRSRVILQFFITCVLDNEVPEDALTVDLKFRKLLKQFFKNNRRQNDDSGQNPLFSKSRTTITPKFLRNEMDVVSAFTVILQAEVLSG